MASQCIPDGYKLRKFSEEDIEKVVSINRLCLPENYTPSFFLDIYKSNPETFIVAEYEREVVGYVMVRVELGFSEIHRLRFARKGHIVSIAVMPEHRLKGIGSTLMHAAIKAMAEVYTCQETYLEVRVSNTGAIKMYRRLGYNATRRLTGYYVDGEDAVLMILQLPKRYDA